MTWRRPGSHSRPGGTVSALAPIALGWIVLAIPTTIAAQVTPDAEAEAQATTAEAVAEGEEVYEDEPEPPESYRDPPPPPGPRYPGAEPSATAPIRLQEGGLRIPAPISARLRVLSIDLDALAARGGSSVASGILSVVTGGLAITLGLLFDDESVATFFYVFGGASVARGIFDLALAPDPYGPGLEFAHMPMRTPREVRLRLRYGESSLEDLADRTHLSRIVDGTLSIGAGVLIVPLALAPNDFEFDDALDYFVVIGASISVLSGVISLISPSDAERRWHAYRVLRARLRRQPRRAAAPTTTRGFVAPLPGGGAAFVLQHRF